MSETTADRGQFRSLPRTECLSRLSGGSIGRVGWNTVDGPQILPVTYAFRDGLVIFRTAPYGVLSELRTVRPVAFEVDDFDVSTHSGWSVLVLGRSRAATNPDELVDLWSRGEPVPWATGSRNLFITIKPEQITGRAVAS